MPFYDYRCPDCGRQEERLASRDAEAIACPCGGAARRAEVYPVNFTHGGQLHDVPLTALHQAAQEMEYQVNRSDDPAVTGPGNRIAHAAKVRAEARILAGATTYRPDARWDAKEAE